MEPYEDLLVPPWRSLDGAACGFNLGMEGCSIMFNLYIIHNILYIYVNVYIYMLTPR